MRMAKYLQRSLFEDAPDLPEGMTYAEEIIPQRRKSTSQIISRRCR